MKDTYKCNHCGTESPDKFTRRVRWDCRDCRSKKAKDSRYFDFKDAVENQNLVNKHWIVA